MNMTLKKTSIFIHVKKIIYSYFLIVFNYKTATQFLFLLFLICLFMPYIHAESNINKNELKSAYLYKIIKFIEWPESAFSAPNSTFNLCVIGENPFKAYFYGLTDQKIQGHTLHIEHRNNYEKLTECHMLYMALAEESEVMILINKLQNLPILTLSDSPNFAKNQGMIGFITQKNRIGFEINLTAALSSHISIRAELLEVAHKVITSQEGL